MVCANKSTSFISIFFKVHRQIQSFSQSVVISRSLDPLARNKEMHLPDHWVPPQPDFRKLNVDGVVREHGSCVGCGGIARDQNGHFIFGFSTKLEPCSMLESKLWATYHGLSLLWGKGIRKGVVESDSQLALDLIDMSSTTHLPLSHIIDGIHNIIME